VFRVFFFLDAAKLVEIWQGRLLIISLQEWASINAGLMQLVVFAEPQVL
jgi:hypothetical protein